MNNDKNRHSLGFLKVVIISLVLYISVMYAMSRFLKIDTSRFHQTADKISTVIYRADGSTESYEPGEDYTIYKGDHFVMSFTPDNFDYVKDGVLYFDLYNCCISVECGLKTLYVQSVGNLREGEMLGDRNYAVILPDDYIGHKITIEGYLMSNSPFGRPGSVLILPFDKANQGSLADNEFVFYTFFSLDIVSILIGIFFIALSIHNKKVLPGIWAAITAIVICTWYLGYKGQFYVISGWDEFNAVSEYVAIFAINIPLSFFMHGQYHNHYLKNLALGMGVFYILFFAISTTLNYSASPIQYCDLLVYSHLTTGVGLLFFIVSMFIDDNSQKRYDFMALRYGICLALLFGALSLLSFNLSGTVQSNLKIQQFNLVPIAIMILVFSLYVSVFTSYVQETISTMEAEQLQQLAYVDPLTGIPNRYYLYDQFAHLEEKGIKDYVIVFMDVNDLKKTNDLYGHDKGDDLIVHISSSISASFPNDNINGCLGRWGGDEFIACVFGNEAKADEYIGNFVELIDALNEQKIEEFTISVSIGKAISTAAKPLDTSAAINEADKVMYQNKELYKKSLVTKVS